MKKSLINHMAVLMMAMFLFYGCGGIMGAEIKLDQGKYEEAIPMLEKYLAENPGKTQARGRLGFAYLKIGQLDRAIKELETVKGQSPDDPYASFYLGLAYLNKKEYSKAINIWQSFRDKSSPLVEAEIKKLQTLVQIAASKKAAKNAVANEAKLNAAKPDKNTIAVCYYDDLSPKKELKALQKGLTAMVITNLAKIKSIKVLERIQMQALLEEMHLGQTGIVDTASAPRVGRLLGAETVVVGNLSKGSINVVTTLTSATDNETIGSSGVTLQESDFFMLPAAIVGNIAKLKQIPLSKSEQNAIGKIQTKNMKAFIFYGQALDALDAGDWKKAKNFYAMAIVADPGFQDAVIGMEFCPDINAPSIDDLYKMNVKDLAQKVEKSYVEATDRQAEIDNTSVDTTGDVSSGGVHEAVIVTPPDLSPDPNVGSSGGSHP